MAKRRKFWVNSVILPSERSTTFFVDPREHNIPLLDKIELGEYVLLHGSRASGKSTRTWVAMEQLHDKGYICI